ncbi:hypothetical protein EAH72_33445 [Pseudomonas caspiana]|nr:hypothetical protein [Pseudomonas caspiana]TPG88263.1 hypothetical protein EAH72_33445 [Pseudomonas caspiana]
MSFSRLTLVAFCAVLMTGCDKGPNVTIPAGSRIFIKANHLADTLVGKVLPTEWKGGNFERAEYNFSQILVESNCSFSIPVAWDSRINRQAASTGTLKCDGTDPQELQGNLVDDNGMMGRNAFTVGDIITFVVARSTTVN